MSKARDTKKQLNREKHERLLRLFDGEGYEEFHAPKYVFVKQWNGGTERWEVAIYTKDSWQRKEEYNRNREHLKDIMHE